jgi:adenosylcobinamide-phosphate synthase
MIALARAMHPVVADVVSIGIIYTTIAARDLARHSNAVRQALAAGDLPEARRRVAMMVGRDTDHLDEQGIVRGTVESVAESTVDGVTAPLFFAAVAGPVGAMVYRAISTLDSTFGHRNERYLEFGWASAKLDDVANYIPARLTAPLICVAAALTFQRPLASFRTLLRDGGNHDSPNAGLPEAAMAGALGVRLGGLNYYFGRPVSKPAIGEPARKLSRAHIANANAVMFATAAIFLAAVLSLRHLALLVAERLGMTL